jgi:hypothetical protein
MVWYPGLGRKRAASSPIPRETEGVAVRLRDDRELSANFRRSESSL